jgi:hypothetical protein
MFLGEELQNTYPRQFTVKAVIFQYIVKQLCFVSTCEVAINEPFETKYFGLAKETLTIHARNQNPAIIAMTYHHRA